MPAGLGRARVYVACLVDGSEKARRMERLRARSLHERATSSSLADP